MSRDEEKHTDAPRLYGLDAREPLVLPSPREAKAELHHLVEHLGMGRFGGKWGVSSPFRDRTVSMGPDIDGSNGTMHGAECSVNGWNCRR